MDELTWVDYALVAGALASAVFAGVQALQARSSRRTALQAEADAARHEEAARDAASQANAARQEASNALTEIADIMRDRADAESGWVAESQGGDHKMWDVTNRTGHPRMARLSFDQHSQAQAPDAVDALFDRRIEPGESLEFKWVREAPSEAKVVRVSIIWSSVPSSAWGPEPLNVWADNQDAQKERVTVLRVAWPE